MYHVGEIERGEGILWMGEKEGRKNTMEEKAELGICFSVFHANCSFFRAKVRIALVTLF